VRFFDTRNLLRPLAESHVGGGVWRLKWHSAPERQNNLLVACMHDGFKIVNYSRDTEPTILQEFRQHESLAYGADWYAPPGAGSAKTTVASCSFYDHKLCLWTA
jgi:diphthine methyl ester acylhydrolase